MKKEAIGPKITLSNTGCPDDMPETFTAEINTSRYGLALNAIASVRYRDPDAPHHATPYRVCRVTDLKPLPNYMDGKRTCVTFERVKEAAEKSHDVASYDLQWMGVRAKTQDFIESLRIHRASVKTPGEVRAFTTIIDKLYRFLDYATSAAGLFSKEGGAK